MRRVLLFGGTSDIAARLIRKFDTPHYDLTVLTGRPWTPPAGVTHHLVELSTYDGTHTTEWHGHYDWVIFIPPLILARSILQHFNANEAVFISSHNTRLFADSRSYAPYIAAENEVLRVLPQTVILQPTMITGRGDDAGLCRLIRLAQRLPVIPVISAQATRQPIHLDDVARAVMTALETAPPGGRYGIGGPDILSQGDVIRKIQAETGRRKFILPLPRWVATILSKLGGRRLWAQQLGRASADRDIDPDAALPGFRPQVSFDQALTRTMTRMAALDNLGESP